MELKKSKKANLESWRGIFFTLGLVTALGLILVAFEWKSQAIQILNTDAGTTIFEVDLVQITKREKPKPKVKVSMIIDKIKLVDNKTDLKNEVIVPERLNEGFEVLDFKDEPEIDSFEPFFKYPEDPAEFPGNLSQYIKDNVVYPEIARKLNIQGIVYLRFRVDSKGNVCNIEIERGVDPSVDEEAIRVLKAMPRWKPAVQGDIKVATEIVIPINFILSN